MLRLSVSFQALAAGQHSRRVGKHVCQTVCRAPESRGLELKQLQRETPWGLGHAWSEGVSKQAREGGSEDPDLYVYRLAQIV